MSIHIGKIIKDIVKSRQMDVTEFAKKINYTRRNAYKIFNKPSIDTNLLVKINKVLGENLFLNYLTDQEMAESINGKVKTSLLLESLKNIENKMSALSVERSTITAGMTKKGKEKKTSKK
jgi:predicted transcriptional regulator